MTVSSDTIYALASAQGVAGVAVIRVSGGRAAYVFRTLTKKDQLPLPRQTSVQNIYSSVTPDKKLDTAMVIYFEGPRSFTGEDVLELHLHGGPVVVESVLDALSEFENVRLAMPGEFTRRAFENGKLDLTEAEAIGDLIHAETQAQHELAIGQMDGAISKIYDEWSKRLAKLLAYSEAEIDFPDEDLPESLIDTLRPQIQTLIEDFDGVLNKSHVAEKLRKGIVVTIIGAPNAGKSSLLNALANEDVAIVTDLAGTTRDVLDVRMNIGGYAVTVSDTAGLRDKLNLEDRQDAIEAEGIKRALKRASSSDYRLLVIDASDLSATHDDIMSYDHLIDDHCFIVLNKLDLLEDSSIQGLGPMSQNAGVFKVSAHTKEGLDQLIAAIELRLSKDFQRTDHTVLTRARHSEALKLSRACLERASAGNHYGDELLAEDLRLALRHLGRITGRVDVEDLLDIVFKDFCIGK